MVFLWVCFMVVQSHNLKQTTYSGSNATIAELAERAYTLINYLSDKEVIATFTKEGVDEITACIAVKLCKGLHKNYEN